MAFKSLPVKYYLDHFNEFLAYVEGPCAHLLAADDLAYMKSFRALAEDAQCVLVRVYNRQSQSVRRDSLHYDEIDNSELAIEQLSRAGFLRAAAGKDWPQWAMQLNKAELQSLVAEEACDTQVGPPPKSARKSLWSDFVANQVSFEQAQAWLNRHYVVQGQNQRLSYFLFLYFGTTRARLNQLSMRDLGIMRTRRLAHQAQARFASREEAYSTFLFRCLHNQLKEASDTELDALATQVPKQVYGVQAEEAKDLFYEQLGKRVLSSELAQHDDDLALAYLAQSEAPGAVEKRLRHRYAAGHSDEVRKALEGIIDDPSSEALLVFATDFYQRKFNRKRTSVLTDILRQSATPLALDEAYTGNVESGVKAWYQRQGLQAYKTENRLWRAFFGLVFWEELFENPKAGLGNEFDRLPPVLKANRFYQHMATDIEQKLALFTDAEKLWQFLLRVSTEKYGRANGVFRWHPNMLDIMRLLTTHVSTESLLKVLRAMAQDYQTLNDGFADLMVVTEQGLRFEEIKAPGDSLRRNQLISMQMLSRAGIEVRVQAVEWRFNPQQDYVVIDVETTGGNHSGHRVTEVGMVKVHAGEIIERWQSLINPQRHIPQRITQLTGIDNEMVEDAPLFSEVVDDIDQFLAGSIFVAHNVNFDYGFIKREYERCGRQLRLPKQCTVRLARQYFPGQVSYSLGKLCQSLQVPLTRHHRALDDAEAAAKILLKVQQKRLQGT